MPADPAEVTRGEALRHSLISTHPLLEVEGGRFVSPLEREGPRARPLCERAGQHLSRAAGRRDAAVLGAAIVLPDHPELAPESLGNLFDNTEIEEALLLHVHALTDDEREEIAGQDPAVREMIERAESTTGDEILGLHGRLTYTEPEAGEAPSNGRPPTPPPGLDEIQGEREVGGRGERSGSGDKIVLRPGTEGDVYDKILHGRTATVERIYRGYDERIYLGVTVDDDPGQELLRETGRFLFFFADEVEPVAMSEHEPQMPDLASSTSRSCRTWRSRSWSPGSATPGSETTASGATWSAGCSRWACRRASRSRTSAPAGSTSPTR